MVTTDELKTKLRELEKRWNLIQAELATMGAVADRWTFCEEHELEMIALAIEFSKEPDEVAAMIDELSRRLDSDEAALKRYRERMTRQAPTWTRGRTWPRRSKRLWTMGDSMDDEKQRQADDAELRRLLRQHLTHLESEVEEMVRQRNQPEPNPF